MTKRWSSTASLDGKTKRQASKDARRMTREERAEMERATQELHDEFDRLANGE